MRLSFPLLGSLLFFFFIFQAINTISGQSETQATRVLLKTCKGWQLNKLPKVKEFIIKDSHDYGVPVEYSGGDPKFLFYDNDNNLIETVILSPYNRDEIKEILLKRGFKKINQEL